MQVSTLCENGSKLKVRSGNSDALKLLTVKVYFVLSKLHNDLVKRIDKKDLEMLLHVDCCVVQLHDYGASSRSA